MTTKKLGRAALAALCSITLVSASCGGPGGGGEQTLEIDGGAQPRAAVGEWGPELSELRNTIPEFQDSAAVGALPARAWADDGGGAHYSIPLDVAPGPAGHAPSLSLSYSSQSGNGPFGVGFSVAGTSMVSRCQRNLAKDGYYEALTMGVDDPICYGGERLVLYEGTYGLGGSTYRLESDPSKKFGYKGYLDQSQEGARWWMETAGGEVHTFVSVDGALDRWRLASRTDGSGNRISYSWSVLADQEVVLSQIAYGGTGTPDSARKVIFNYEDDRPDVREGYVRGEFFRRTQRANEIRVEGQYGELLSRYELDYEPHPHTRQSILVSVTKFDAKDVELPPTVFEWTAAEVAPIDEVAVGTLSDAVFPSFTTSKLRGSQTLLVGDYDGDRSDEVLTYQPDDGGYQLHGVVPGHAVDVNLPAPEFMPEPWEPPPAPYPYHCGNGVLDPGESCDGDPFLSSCSAVGLDDGFPPSPPGTATCSASCQADYSACSSCPSPAEPLCQPPEPAVPEPIELTDLHRIRPSLGLTHINFDHDELRSQLLMPVASAEGVDAWGISWAERLSVGTPHNDPSQAWQDGADLNFDFYGYTRPDPVYTVVPLEFNGDGRDDLFLCQGQGYKTSHWHLALSKDVVETGEIGWDFYDTGVGCSTHDETTVLPHPRGTEVLAVIPRFPTSDMEYPDSFDSPQDYQDEVEPIDEAARGGYRVLEFNPETGDGGLSEEVLARDLYQRWSDLNCNNGYVATAEGAPLLGSGLSRDRAIDVDGDGNRDLIRFELLDGDGLANLDSIRLETADDGSGYTYEPSCELGPAQPGVLRVYRNTGDGYVPADEPAFEFNGAPHENLFLNWYGAQFTDWNGDGLTDILLPSDGAADNPEAPEQDEDWTLLLSTGDGGFMPLDVQGGMAWSHYIHGADTEANTDTFSNGRILSLRGASVTNEGNNTGWSYGHVSQIFVRAGQSTEQWFSRQRHKGALLLSATDGQGLEHSFGMARAGNRHVLRSRHVNTPGTGVPRAIASKVKQFGSVAG